MIRSPLEIGAAVPLKHGFSYTCKIAKFQLNGSKQDFRHMNLTAAKHTHIAFLSNSCHDIRDLHQALRIWGLTPVMAYKKKPIQIVPVLREILTS